MKNYFSLKEQACKCGCGTGRFAVDFLEKLNLARSFSPVAFIINSGFRCYKHNLEIGGSESSSHLTGCAADIKAEDSRTRFIIIKALLDAGFTRIGIHSSFIHVDIDEFMKPEQVIWLYK